MVCVPAALAQGSVAGELKSNAKDNSQGQMATFIYLYSQRCQGYLGCWGLLGKNPKTNKNSK